MIQRYPYNTTVDQITASLWSEQCFRKEGIVLMKQGMNLTAGRLWDKLLLLALPLVLMNILQQLFNTADIAVLGRLVGSDALAAVGCTGPVVMLFITVFSGLSVGANAIIAMKIGSGQKQEIHDAVHSAVTIALLSGFLVMIVGELSAPWLLRWMDTPEHLMDMAVLYLRIYFAGSVFIMLYNFEAAIMRANGDTRRPLYVLVLSGLLNIVLNLFFVIVCHWNVEGVAIATLISNICSALLLLVLLIRDSGDLAVHLNALCLKPSLVRAVLAVGIPAALQGMVFNVANIVIQSGINSLGAVVVAGSTIGLNLEVFLYYMIMGFGQACVTANGQNLGAHKLDRCIAATKWCLGLGAVCTILFSMLAIVFSRELARLFSTDPAVLDVASYRLCLIAACEGIALVIEVLSGALRGQGYSTAPAFLSILFSCGVRIVWLLFVFPEDTTFSWLMMAYPVSYILAAISIVIAYLWIQHHLRTAMAADRSRLCTE